MSNCVYMHIFTLVGIGFSMLANPIFLPFVNACLAITKRDYLVTYTINMGLKKFA